MGYMGTGLKIETMMFSDVFYLVWLNIVSYEYLV